MLNVRRHRTAKADCVFCTVCYALKQLHNLQYPPVNLLFLKKLDVTVSDQICGPLAVELRLKFKTSCVSVVAGVLFHLANAAVDVLPQRTRRRRRRHRRRTVTTCTTWISWYCTPTTRPDAVSTTSTRTCAVRCRASTTPCSDAACTWHADDRDAPATCTSKHEASPTDTADCSAPYSVRSWSTSDVTAQLLLTRSHDSAVC